MSGSPKTMKRLPEPVFLERAGQPVRTVPYRGALALGAGERLELGGPDVGAGVAGVVDRPHWRAQAGLHLVSHRSPPGYPILVRRDLGAAPDRGMQVLHQEDEMQGLDGRWLEGGVQPAIERRRDR